MKTKMLLFWIHFVFMLLPMCYSVPYPSNRCYRNDCFYQVPDFKNDICKIYNTSVCLEFYNFDESSEKIYEDESKFLVQIVPYTAELFVPHLTAKRSAINFTFTINSSDINELAVKIFTKVSSNPICRIFDFQNANNSLNLPINLFYDCLFNMVEHGMQNVRMDFITLPMLRNQSYNVFIPGIKYDGSCIWQPLIMVFNGGLQKGEVQVKFSQAPELYNVTTYIVKLTETISGDEKIVNIIPDANKSMLLAQFSSVDDGVYSVSVKPIFLGENDNCWTETDIFQIEKTKSDYMLIIYLCVFILLLFSALVFLKMFGWNIAKLRYGAKRRILLVYSHDCSEHTDFVSAFIDYLTKYCFVEVSTIYGDECNPLEWIRKKYIECDIIMYLISAGLFHALDSKHFLHLQTAHEWRKQPLWTTVTIFSELSNNFDFIKKKKICQVCFPYSNKEHIPDRLRVGYGQCYFLPHEMNSLMNFIHGSKDCSPCSKLCVTNFNSSSESVVLFDKMKAVQAAVDSNSHIHIIRPLSDTIKNDLNISDVSDILENCDDASTTSDENSDAVINLLSRNEESFSAMSSSDNIDSALKNKDFAEQESEFDSAESSDSEEQDFLFYQPKLQSENEAKSVIENILSKK